MKLISLPMYEIGEEVRDATDRLFVALRSRLHSRGFTELPDALDRRDDFGSIWSSADLLLSQACGANVALTHAGQLTVVAAPVYALDRCEGAAYHSVAVARRTETRGLVDLLRNGRVAVNDLQSHSGGVMLARLLREHQVPAPDALRITGGHVASIEAVKAGTADIAVVDGITWELIVRHRPDWASQVSILGESDSWPAPPFVTTACCSEDDVEALRGALQEALLELDPADREALMLDSIVAARTERYEPMRDEGMAARAFWAAADW